MGVRGLAFAPSAWESRSRESPLSPSEEGEGDECETGLEISGWEVKIQFRGTDPDSMAKENTGEVAVTFFHVAQGGCWEGRQDVTVSPLSDNHSFHSLNSYLLSMSFRSRHVYV